MRIRSIKPEYWQDERLARLSRDARLVYIALWNAADDQGRLRGSLPYLQGTLFPYDQGPWLAAALSELAKTGRAIAYQQADASYYYLPKMRKHQVITRPSASRLPPPPEPLTEPSLSPHGALTEPSEPRARAREQGAGSREMEQGGGGGAGEGAVAPASSAGPATETAIGTASGGVREDEDDDGDGTGRRRIRIKTIGSGDPKEGLDGPDLVRRGFARLYRAKFGVEYPGNGAKDRKAASTVLSYHRRVKIAEPWQAWVAKVVAAYLDLEDDFLTRDGYPLCRLPTKLPGIVTRLAAGGAVETCGGDLV